MKMITIFVLFKVQRDKINEVAENLAKIEGVSEVYSIAGRYDIIAIIRVPDYEIISELVPMQISKIEGIVNSETMFAFRVYSRHDLERMFSIGMEE